MRGASTDVDLLLLVAAVEVVENDGLVELVHLHHVVIVLECGLAGQQIFPTGMAILSPMPG